ncbi:MAG: DUF1446 domain-containing protein [Candidatus Omnitrophica bacterium]|nr:DUF1446 domain-containing protein [Candidatus Omnitrophota bacterium]
MIRIASASGYWGDWSQAPALQVRSGPIDYLVLDYLAEVTLSIMSRQRAKDQHSGFASDFIRDVGPLIPEILDKGITVIANAGGVNPRACAQAFLSLAKEQKVSGLRVAVVEGDDVLELLQSKKDDPNIGPLTSDEKTFGEVRNRLTAAHAYLSCGPVVEALKAGANVVITGRISDPGLFLAPIVHEFGTAEDDWDSLAFGTVVGHILECGGQASGGNYLGDWKSVPNLERLGFPIAEVHDKSHASITKHESLGGLINQAVIKEQLVYEIGDPTQYTTPDCTADFTTIQLSDEGKNRVGVTGVRGGTRPERLKVAGYYEDGWMVSGQISYPWPDAVAKARAAGELLRKRTLQLTGDRFEEWRIEAVGQSACHGDLSLSSNPDEVTLRVAARSQDRDACEVLAREFSPLVLTGPPGATGFAGGRPRPSRVHAYWAGLIPREWVKPRVEVLES